MEPILTLTTDFGTTDFHLGRLKGYLLAAYSDIRIIDISHDIPNYDIARAAFIFKKVWQHYPEGTVHLISVNDYYQPRGRFVAMEKAGQYFIGPDNGVFSLIFGELPERLVVIDTSRVKINPYRGSARTDNGKIETTDTEEQKEKVNHKLSLSAIYSWAVAELLDVGLDSLGEPSERKLKRIPFHPVIGKNYIRGSVVFIDKFDNALTNISRELFEQVGKGRGFKLLMRRNEPIDGLSFRYQDVPEGESLCKFNSDDELEIAINLGKAAGLLSIEVEDTVQVEFG
ncbi:MAG: SAM-dependent chlorinase/fluorinase [Bacteroidota bacterium]